MADASARAGYEAVTVQATAIGVTQPDGDTSFVSLDIFNADVRMRYDGVAAVAGAGGGKLLREGRSYHVKGASKIKKLSMIRNASVDAVVDCTYA